MSTQIAYSMSRKEYQPKVEQPGPSVMLRLMGIDDFPMWQPVVKRSRVLSDGYLQKVASIGVRKKSAERYSLYEPTEEEKECEHVFNVVQAFKKDNCFKMLSRKRVANSASIEKMPFTRQKVMRPVCESPNERLWNSKECQEGPIKVACTKVNKIVGWRQRASRYFRAQEFSSRWLFLQPRGIGASKSSQEQINGTNYSAVNSSYPDAAWLGDAQHREFQTLLRGNLCVKTRERKTSTGVSKHALQRSRFSKQVTGNIGRGTNRFQNREMWIKSAKVQQAGPDKNSLYPNVMDVPPIKVCGLVADGKIEKREQTTILLEKQSESCHNLMSEIDEVFSSHALGAIFQQTASEKESLSSYHSVSEPEYLISFEENCHRSPNSVLLPVGQEEISFSSNYFKSVQSDLEQSEMYSEGSCIVSGDEDNDKEFVSDRDEIEFDMGMLRAKECRNFSYLVDVLTEAGLDKHKTHVDPDLCVISSHVFEALEKKYGKQITWKRSERRLLFDRLNSGLQDMLQQSTGIQDWTKSVARRLILGQVEEAIEDELWMILASQERVATSESEMVLEKYDKWMVLTEEIQVIVREIEHSLIDELVEEAVNVENC